MRAALLQLPGVMAVAYDQEQDYFSVTFESVMISLETIFAAVFQAGKQMGREYLPEMISDQ